MQQEERLGGRLYTHYFSEETEETHDYYDVGAMRFPDIPVMKQCVLDELQCCR